MLLFLSWPKSTHKPRNGFFWGQGIGNVCNKFDHIETLVGTYKFKNPKFVGSH